MITDSEVKQILTYGRIDLSLRKIQVLHTGKYKTNVHILITLKPERA